MVTRPEFGPKMLLVSKKFPFKKLVYKAVGQNQSYLVKKKEWGKVPPD